MKRLLLLLMGCCGLVASAASVEDLYCELIDGEVVILDSSWMISGHLTIPETIEGYPVTAIAPWAFISRANLTSVTLPNTLREIGEHAFAYCENLTSVKLSNTLRKIDDDAFCGCTKLRTISLPSSLEKLGEYAFEDCRSLTSITIPSRIQYISESMFEDCSGLTSVTLNEGLKYIGFCAFWGCSNLTSLTIPASVDEIDGAAFAKCQKLSISVNSKNPYYTVQNGILFNKQKTYLLSYPRASGSYQIPDHVTGIGVGAFIGCEELTSVKIHANVTEINVGAFGYCPKVLFTVDAKNPSYVAVDGGLFNKQKTILLYPPSGRTSYQIPSGVKEVSHLAFAGRSDLISVTIPNSVTTLRGGAFDCTGLTSITIPSSVTEIVEDVFDGCENLTSVTLSEGVKFIGEDAFRGTGLKTITIPASVTTLEGDAFSECKNLTRFNFMGLPPSWDEEEDDIVNQEGVMGYYPTTYAAAWEKVLDWNGSWRGLKMAAYTPATSVTLTFDANGGSGGKTLTQTSNTALIAPTVTRTGYTFTGWSPTVPTKVPAKNTTYKAQWKINQYKQTFNANGGTGGKTLTQNYKSALTAPTVTRTGYTFTGWSPSVPATVPAKNATYKAQWKINQYKQTFNANGGTGGKTVTQNYNTALTAPTVKRTGYTFTGWSPTVPTKVPAKNTTYKAQWKINQYKQTFDANGGTGGKTLTQNYKSSLTAPTVTRDGYVFIGWSSTVPTTVPAKNVTYQAQWKANSDYLKTSVAKNQVTITGYTKQIVGTLIIPSKMGGKPVVAIAKDALKGQAKLTKVVIPSGVTSIGENAFAGCTKITTLSLPATLKTVGKNAFSKVAPTTLTAAKLPGGGMTTSKITKVTIAADATSVEYKAFYGLKSMTSLTIHSKVKAIYGRAFENCTGLTSLTLPKGVTTLGGNAFAGCTEITTLSLPATLKSVGSNAFSKVAPKTLTAAKLPGGGMTTSKMTKVTIAADATSVEYKAFYGLKSMTSLTIHSKVKAIYGRAFENCTGLTSLTLPKDVTTLGGNAFAGCTKITTLSLPATLKSVGSNAFSKVAPKTLTAAKLPGGGMTTSKITKVAIAADATSVEYKAFCGLKSMTSLTIHSKVKAIYGRAFENCTGLTSLTLPKGVTTLGGNAFAGCTEITTLSLPATLKSVGSNAFNKVAPKTLTAAKLPGGGMTTSKITKVTIAADATSVEYKAFYGLKSMTSLTIHSKVKAIYGRAFEKCTGLKTLTLPKGVTTLGGYAFSGCTKLTTVTLPSSLTSVASTSFNLVAPQTLTAAKVLGGMSIANIKTVKIPSGVQKLDWGAFKGCTKLTSLTLSDGVKTLSTYAFDGCSSLREVTIPASVTLVGGNVFHSALTSVTFLGTPPNAQNDSFPAAMGYYLPQYEAKWKASLDSKGMWHKLTMRPTGTVATAPMSVNQELNSPTVEEAEAEMIDVIPAWTNGIFEGEVLTMCADDEVESTMVITLTADGSLMGEWFAEGMALCLTGSAEIVEATDAAITLKVTDGWTNAPTTLMVKRTETGVTMDYQSADGVSCVMGTLKGIAQP